MAPFEKFFQIANFFYATVGIEPYKDALKYTWYNRYFIQQILFYAGMINLNFHFVGELAFVARAFSEGAYFVEATMTASYIGFVAMADCKMLSVWYMKDMLTHLMSELRRMYPSSPEKQESYQLQSYLRHVSFVMFLFAALYNFLIWTFNLFNPVRYETYRHRGIETEQFLPYFIYLPWDWHGTSWYYYLTASQIIAGCSSASGIISSDLLLCAVATQVCMHYDYIGRRVEEFHPTGGTDDIGFLREMIRYHKKVLELSDVVNDVFGVSLLFNFAASSFIICFVGFQMTTGVTGEELFKYMLFLLSSMTQVYLVCYYGQRITTSSENIAVAVYNQIWYMNASSSYKKSLIVILRRAQKPAQLTATTFLKISLGTFTEIVQLSYKFFALLRTMYGR